MERYKYDLKIDRKFPFIHIIKRKEYNTERIVREVREAFNIIPIIMFISLPFKFYDWCKNILKQKG